MLCSRRYWVAMESVIATISDVTSMSEVTQTRGPIFSLAQRDWDFWMPFH